MEKVNHRIRFVVLRHSHHSPHSGYSRLAEYGVTEYDGVAIKAKPFPSSIIRKRIMYWLANGVIAYDRAAIAAELTTALKMLTEKGCIYHILYGGITYHYLGYLNNYRQNRIVATFHQPPRVIPQIVKTNWHIRQLSAVICVGRAQEEYFADFIDRDRIFFVPLGVDIKFFTPPTSFDERDENLCLFVPAGFGDLFAVM